MKTVCFFGWNLFVYTRQTRADLFSLTFPLRDPFLNPFLGCSTDVHDEITATTSIINCIINSFQLSGDGSLESLQFEIWIPIIQSESSELPERCWITNNGSGAIYDPQTANKFLNKTPINQLKCWGEKNCNARLIIKGTPREKLPSSHVSFRRIFFAVSASTARRTESQSRIVEINQLENANESESDHCAHRLFLSFEECNQWM